MLRIVEKTNMTERDQGGASPRPLSPPGQSTSWTEPVELPPFALVSPDFLAGGETVPHAQLFHGRGYTGENLSLTLEWSNAPAGTKSLAITLYDLDARAGKGCWHWVMYNIPPNVSRLAAGAGDPSRSLMPGVTHGNTDFGTPGYIGPCPPKGDKPHRYIFTVHALGVARIEVPANATAAFIGFSIGAHRLASATLTCKYGR